MKAILSIIALFFIISFPDKNKDKGRKKLPFMVIYPCVNKTKVNDTIVTYRHGRMTVMQKYNDTIKYPSNYKLYIMK